MHHNYRIELTGVCSCKCHEGSSRCDCGLTAKVRAWFSPPKPKRRGGRRPNLESRVRPFQRRHLAVMGAYLSRIVTPV